MQKITLVNEKLMEVDIIKTNKIKELLIKETKEKRKQVSLFLFLLKHR